MVRCEIRRFEYAPGRTFSPGIGQSVQDEKGGQFTQAFLEPLVPVLPGAVKVGQYAAQLMRKLVNIIAPVTVPCGQMHLVWTPVVNHEGMLAVPWD